MIRRFMLRMQRELNIRVCVRVIKRKKIEVKD